MSYSFNLFGPEDGEPLLLLHGFTGTKESWAPILPQLSSKFLVITLDLPGHGQTDSSANIKYFTMESVVESISVLLTKLKIEKTNILGYSMGGRVALSFLCMQPDRVKKCVLESSSPGLKTKEERLQRQCNDKKLANFLLEKGIEEFVNYWENIPLFSTQKLLDEQTKKYIRQERISQNPIGLANSLKGMGTGVQPSWWGHLSKITHPVLILTGEEDRKFCEIGKEMVSLLSNGIYAEIHDSGHAIHVEKKEKFVKMVMDFLNE